MNERAAQLGGALLALVLVLALLVTPGEIEPAYMSRPNSADRGPSGTYAARSWLARAGVPTASLRDRYTSLGRLGAPTGNLLIATLPQLSPARLDERTALRRWIESGNTVLFLIAERDDPPWRQLAAGRSTDALENALGLSRSESDTAQCTPADRSPLPVDGGDAGGAGVEFPGLSDPPSDRTERMRPVGAHAWLTGIREVAVRQAGSSDGRAPLPGDKAGLSVALLRDADDAGAALWTMRAGAGRIVVFLHSNVFANAMLGEADNARLLANLSAFLVGTGGKVVFDDMHQGLSALYDPKAFYRDPRLHATLLFLVGFWIAWIAGHGNRFGPPEPPARDDPTRFVRSVGGLLARRLDSTQAAAALIGHFDRTRGIAPATERADPLQDARRLIATGQSPDLVALANHLRRLRTET
ncbi:MAG: DUF4350 domain-containing protein [Gammaproteobacteria bacterium]